MRKAAVNMADNILHVVLTVALLVIGFGRKSDKRLGDNSGARQQ
jgi:hypothetical protein